MMPICVLVTRIRRQTSKPSIPGSIMSSSATLVSGFSLSRSNASSPVSASMTSYPARRRLMTMKLRMLASSSKTKTFFIAGIPFCKIHAFSACHQLSLVSHSVSIRLKASRTSSSVTPYFQELLASSSSAV